MLVVIEIDDDDWNSTPALLAELAMLQKSHEDIINDPAYEPEDQGDETMRLKTDTIALDVTRVVGVLDDSLAKQTSGLYRIELLEA